ncbi:MAG: hypothetical protein NVS2B3_15320 [Vulcanimicrobiaceae bacterium]
MIHIDNAAEFALLRLDGTVEHTDAGALDTALENLDSEPIIIVSLEHAGFLESGVVAVLQRAHLSRPGNLVVVLPPSGSHEAPEPVTDLRALFRYAPTLSDAIAIARTLRDVAGASYSRDGVAVTE